MLRKSQSNQQHNVKKTGAQAKNDFLIKTVYTKQNIYYSK